VQVKNKNFDSFWTFKEISWLNQSLHLGFDPNNALRIIWDE